MLERRKLHSQGQGGRGTAATRVAALCLCLVLAAPPPARADSISDGNNGRTALLNGQTDEAIRLLTQAINGGLSQSNLAVTLNLRGRAYLAKGQLEAAMDDLDESIRLVDTADARFNRGTLYLDQYRFDDAIDDLTKSLALGAQGADVYAERGHAYVYTGQINLALKDLDESIRRQPALGFAYRTRGHAYLNAGQDDKAIADETRAIALDPKDLQAYWLRAYAYRFRKKQIAKAIADYTKALAIDPTDPANRSSRAEAYEQTGRYDLALADYDDWIRRNPKASMGYAARGRLNLAQGQNMAAAADLAKAVSLKPTDADTVLWLHLARIRSGVDDKAEFQANAAKLNKAVWPGPVVGYLSGTVPAAQVLEQAAKGETAARASQACEALIFLSQDDMTAGRREQGRTRLLDAQRNCADDIQEAHLVKADLQRGSALPRTVLAAAPAPKAAPPGAPKPITVAMTSPPIPRAKPEALKQTRTTAADPLGLRGSLK